MDLSTGDIVPERLDRKLVEKFIGGMGMGSWLAYKYIRQDTDPISPSNVLVFSASPLTGTIAPGSSRVHVNSKSPDTGFVCYGNAGHSAGIMMKYAGYDHLIITGRAKEPVYLKISDDDVEILDARHLWGKDAWETTDAIQRELGDHWVDCIGPAAESMVSYSIILCGKRSSFNKTGPGTIMGSKNLKAIVALGTRGVKVAHPEDFIRLTRELTERIVNDPELNMWRTYGVPKPPSSPPGFDYVEFREKIAERNYACISCPVACKHLIHLRAGRYDGLCFRNSHLTSLVGHNRLGGPENWEELAKIVELENRYGLEASSTAGILSYLVECQDNGVLSRGESDLTLRRGSQAMRELIPIIVRKEGTGALAAECLKGAIQRVGEKSEM